MLFVSIFRADEYSAGFVTFFSRVLFFARVTF